MLIKQKTLNRPFVSLTTFKDIKHVLIGRLKKQFLQLHYDNQFLPFNPKKSNLPKSTL